MVFQAPAENINVSDRVEAVEGAAPPNHELFAEFPWAGGGIRRVFSGSGSRYGVDTSGAYPPLLSRGRIYLHDEAGNTTSIYFTVTGYQTFLPIIRR